MSSLCLYNFTEHWESFFHQAQSIRVTLRSLIWGTEPQSPGARAGPEERGQLVFREQVKSAVPVQHPTFHIPPLQTAEEQGVALRSRSRPRGSSAHRWWLTPWDGWDPSGRVCRVRREMTRVRSLPSRSSQSSCVHVQAVYPQLDCKLLEGSYHFTHSSPSPTMGVRFLKTPGGRRSQAWGI